jgi:hypothetical protein
MAGYLRLRETERFVDVADADLAAIEEMGNAQPRRVAKCLEGRFKTDQFVTRS